MYVVLFPNARAVVKAERECRAAGLSVAVIAVPSTLSSECGLCLRVDGVELERIKLMFSQCDVYEI